MAKEIKLVRSKALEKEIIVYGEQNFSEFNNFMFTKKLQSPDSKIKNLACMNIFLEVMKRIEGQNGNRSIKLILEGIQSGDKGYLVFRSTSENGPYFQIGNLIQTNDRTYSFEDDAIVTGQFYFYKVTTIKKDGTLSKFSAFKKMKCDTGN